MENQLCDLYHDVLIFDNDMKNLRAAKRDAIKNYAESRGVKPAIVSKAFKLFEAQKNGSPDIEVINDLIFELEKGE